MSCLASLFKRGVDHSLKETWACLWGWGGSLDMLGSDNESDHVWMGFMRALWWGLRSVVLFFHLAFCIFGTRYVKAWNEVITSYLFCQSTNYCFKSSVPSSLVCFCLARETALMWPLVAPLVADSETGGGGVKDVAKEIKQPESYCLSTCSLQFGTLADSVGTPLLIRHTS